MIHKRVMEYLKKFQAATWKIGKSLENSHPNLQRSNTVPLIRRNQNPLESKISEHDFRGLLGSLAL